MALAGHGASLTPFFCCVLHRPGYPCQTRRHFLEKCEIAWWTSPVKAFMVTTPSRQLGWRFPINQSFDFFDFCCGKMTMVSTRLADSKVVVTPENVRELVDTQRHRHFWT